MIRPAAAIGNPPRRAAWALLLALLLPACPTAGPAPPADDEWKDPVGWPEAQALDPARAAPLREVALPGGAILCAASDRKGTLLLAGTAAGQVHLVDPAAGRVVRSWTLAGPVHGLAWSPSGERAAAAVDGEKKDQVVVFDPARDGLAGGGVSEKEHLGSRRVAFDPDGETLWEASRHGDLRLRDPKKATLRRRLSVPDPAGIRALLPRRGRPEIAAADEAGHVRILSTRDHSLLKELWLPSRLPIVDAGELAGGVLALACPDRVYRWDPRVERVFVRELAGTVRAVACHPGGAHLVVLVETPGPPPRARLEWLAADGLKPLRSADLPGPAAPLLVYSPTGRFLAAAAAQGKLWIWGEK